MKQMMSKKQLQTKNQIDTASAVEKYSMIRKESLICILVLLESIETYLTPDKWTLTLTKTLNIGQSQTVNKKPMVMGETILVNLNNYVTVKKFWMLIRLITKFHMIENG